MATLTASGVNFSDGSTINGTTLGAIGSYGVFLMTQGTNMPVGSTVSGSYLFYLSSLGANATCDGGTWYTSIQRTLDQAGVTMTNRTTAYTYSPGVFSATWSPIGGSWRIISGAAKSVSFCGLNYTPYVMAVRIG